MKLEALTRRAVLNSLISLSFFLTPHPQIIGPIQDHDGLVRSEDFIPPQNIEIGNTDRPEVALTFDCGPWVDRSYITRILDTLDQYEKHVTFFVTGEFIRKNPDIFERIAQKHEIANHSWYHPDFTKISTEEQTEELISTEDLIKTYGVSSLPMWRSPFGAFNNETIWNAAANGYCHRDTGRQNPPASKRHPDTGSHASHHPLVTGISILFWWLS